MEENYVFDVEKHAVLTGVFGRAAERALGEYGLQVLGAAVVAYGRQRGDRMRRRVERDGRALSYETYLAYGELSIPSRPGDYSVRSRQPVYINCCHRCLWAEAWKKFGMERYGKVYCDYVDFSLVQGFSPDMVMLVETAIGRGDAVCAFVNVGYRMTDEAERRLAALRAELGDRYKRDFGYHCGHLLNAYDRSLGVVLGADYGTVRQEALGEFARIYSEEAVKALEREAERDFEAI